MFNTLVTMVVVAAWFYFQHSEMQLQGSNVQIREARVDLQNVEQQLYSLKHDGAHPLLRVLGEDVTSLQIRIAEFLKHSEAKPHSTGKHMPNSGDVQAADGARHGRAASDESNIVVTAYEQSLLAPRDLTVSVSDDALWGTHEVFVLRLDVKLKTAHAPQLLTFFKHLEKAVSGWPVDVRACEINRSVAAGLATRCIVDVYHWGADDAQMSESHKQ